MHDTGSDVLRTRHDPAGERGPNKGESSSFGFAGRDLRFAVGDRIRVYEQQLPKTAQIGGVRLDRYQFSDFERRRPLIALVRLRGARPRTARLKGLCLLGLVVSLLVIVFFVVPRSSTVSHRERRARRVAGGDVRTIVLAHGIGPKSIAACLGTASALVLTLLLADVFVDAARLSGLSSRRPST